MTKQAKHQRFAADGIAAPLRHMVFRRIWLASLLSNLGILIQGVGAAWAMTQMTSSADKVALVQTALMLPVMLISMPAGAIADMHDRRIVALASCVRTRTSGGGTSALKNETVRPIDTGRPWKSSSTTSGLKRVASASVPAAVAAGPARSSASRSASHAARALLAAPAGPTSRTWSRRGAVERREVLVLMR